MNMATAVLDIDFEHIPSEITGLDRYRSALVLIRLRGRPVGKTLVQVTHGCIAGVELRDALRDAADWNLWEHWLRTVVDWEEDGLQRDANPSVTVAVCTRDRMDDLRRCLDALMRLPDDGQEFLVVDNCPSDEATARLVGQYPRVRYVREARAGLNHARNRALREARTEVVAFTDDDAVVDGGWLRALRRNFNDGLVLCVTGLTMPLELETEAQEWFEGYSPFGRGFRRRAFDRINLNPLLSGQVGAGVNMALRRSLLELIGPFDAALDGGTATQSGGDNEMFARILTSGYRVVYAPAALSWHRHRRTMEELRHTLYGYGAGVYAAWTSSLLKNRELTVPYLAWQWFRHVQFPNLLRALFRRPGSLPPNLILAELRGCLKGPWAYFRSRRELASRTAQV
jgi:GT2 family glycosyltransferase